MSTTRSVNSRFWSDGWIRKLNALDRYVFLYILTNEHSTWCGIYELPLETMSAETGIKEKDLQEAILPRLTPKIVYVDEWIYIPNWVKYHLSESGSMSPQQKKGFNESFSKVPEKIRLKIKELDTLCIPYTYPIGGVSPSTSTSTSTSVCSPSASAENSLTSENAAEPNPPRPESPPPFDEWMKGQGFQWVSGPEMPDGSFPDVWGDEYGVRLPPSRVATLRKDHKRLTPAPPKEIPVIAQYTSKLIELISKELKRQYGSAPIFGLSDKAILSNLIKRTSFEFVKKYGQWFFTSEKVDKKYKYGVKAFASNDFINRFIAETGISPINE